MVFYFTSSEGYVMYMGRDKFENEDLIKYGLPEDVWFHVDDLSSAHVYLRMRPDQTLDDLSPEAIQECGQLVKANSIEGCKLKECNVLYTRWKNLNKTGDMDVGSIGFKDPSRKRTIKIVKDNVIVNRLNRTKEEKTLSQNDFAELQQARDAEIRVLARVEKKQAVAAAKMERTEHVKAKELKSYAAFMKPEKMKEIATKYGSTIDGSAAKAYEEDFM